MPIITSAYKQCPIDNLSRNSYVLNAVTYQYFLMSMTSLFVKK